MAIQQCPHCGREHPAQAQFCSVTGKPLPARSAPEPPVETPIPTSRPSAGPSRPGCILVLLSLSLFGVVLVVAGGVFLFLSNEGVLESQSASRPTAEKNAARETPNDTATPPMLTLTASPQPTATPTSTFTPSPSATPQPTATPTVAAFSGRIVFVSYRDGDEEIYVMNADGTEQTRLTYSQYGDTEPMLSPDGRFIVFVSQRAGGHKLFIMNADGSNQRQLTDGKSSDEYSPAFSPDGQWLVYSSSRGARFELWRMHLDGTELTQITSGFNAKGLPTWSPDGQWIAYNSVQDGVDVIKRIRPDGTDDQVLLMQAEVYVSGWAGDRILFVAPNGAKTDIYSMQADGSEIRQLTDDPASDKGPFGTADGRFIIFNSARDGNDEIYVIGVGDSNPTRLTFSDGNDYMPAWGP